MALYPLLIIVISDHGLVFLFLLMCLDTSVLKTNPLSVITMITSGKAQRYERPQTKNEEKQREIG